MKNPLNYCITTLELNPSEVVQITDKFTDRQILSYKAYNLGIIRSAKEYKRRIRSAKPLFASLPLQKQNNIKKAIQVLSIELNQLIDNQLNLYKQ